MTKTELSSRVAADVSLSKTVADGIIDAVFSTITGSTKKCAVQICADR